MSKRFTETKKVLDYGFDYFELKQVIAAKSTPKGMESVPVKMGTKTEVPVLTEQAVSFLVPKGTDASQLSYQTNFVPEEVTAPFPAGTKAGTITYMYQIEGMDMIQEKTVNVLAAEELEKAGWFRLLFRSIWEVISGFFEFDKTSIICSWNSMVCVVDKTRDLIDNQSKRIHEAFPPIGNS
ncbi:hypothetical protein ACFYU8_03925 [Brevibacillus sp. NPDC003359]